MSSLRGPHRAALLAAVASALTLSSCTESPGNTEHPSPPAPRSEDASATARPPWPVSFSLEPGTPPAYQRVVLVTFDTLRKDHVSGYGYARPTTPFLDSLAQRGVLFENAVASSSHIAPSHATMLTGLHPIVHGVQQNGQSLDERAVDLARVFAGAGFRTAAFLNVEFLEGITSGFETVEVRLNRGGPVVNAAIEWLATKPAPRRFFIWVHLYDPHHWKNRQRTPDLALRTLRRRTKREPDELLDYLSALHGLARTAPDGPVVLGIDEKKAIEQTRSPADFLEIIDAYDAQILYADRQLEKLYLSIERLDHPGTTLWVATADHGEGLGSHRFAGHGGRIYQEQIGVPLVLHADNGSLGPLRIDALVQHVDLFPTLAATVHARLSGLDSALDGVSLWPLVHEQSGWIDRPAFAQRRPIEDGREGEAYALQTPRHKLILHQDGTDELFDLTDDPLEASNLAERELPEHGSLRRLLEQRVELYRARRQAPGSRAVPEEWLEELRALGYVE